jgi:precorrin-6Y C5,15-methyltransferase (decarboxylating)
VNKVTVVGIGFKPLTEAASRAVLDSDVVLTNNSLLAVFKTYPEYTGVQNRILVHDSVYETIDYIKDHYLTRKLVLLAAGDPMFFGIGGMIVEEVGPESVEILPDLSSVQVAFSRTGETSSRALILSLHGGPDPDRRRALEHGIADLPHLLAQHEKLAILTDRVNSPEKIADELSMGKRNIKMYVCEKLGYSDERITEGTPEELSQMQFKHPNVVIVRRI